ncbi:MAG: hypothetical protein ACR5K5_04185 [Wolbachia sp.]
MNVRTAMHPSSVTHNCTNIAICRWQMKVADTIWMQISLNVRKLKTLL